jgi:hypothetical protein
LAETANQGKHIGSYLEEDQIKLKTSTQNIVTQYSVLSEPKAVPVFAEGSPWNYLVPWRRTAPATPNIKSCTHLIKQKIIKME